MPTDKLIKIIESLKGKAAQNYKVEIKGVFGSYVRGEQSGQSDIDVLVEFSQDADLFDLVGLSQFLEERLSCKVDVVPLSSLREEIKPYVMRELVHL